jgi:hypothetical protein
MSCGPNHAEPSGPSEIVGATSVAAGRVDPDLADWLADIRAGVAGDDVAALLVEVEREGPGLHALVEPGHGPRRIVGGGEVGLDDHEAVALGEA